MPPKRMSKSQQSRLTALLEDGRPLRADVETIQPNGELFIALYTARPGQQARMTDVLLIGRRGVSIREAHRNERGEWDNFLCPSAELGSIPGRGRYTNEDVVSFVKGRRANA